MKITGYTEIDDATYDTNLLLAFSNFIGNDSIEHLISSYSSLPLHVALQIQTKNYQGQVGIINLHLFLVYSCCQ